MSRTNISPLIKSQLEKLTSSGFDISSGHRSLYSSSPIIIPKKPSRSNTSSHSSSSYTSTADQMSSSYETLSQSQREFDDVSSTHLSVLSSTCEKLEHSAAHDRIAVKNKRRQPAKFRLSSLREIEDNQTDIFSTEFDDDRDTFSSSSQAKFQSQSVMNLSELHKTREFLNKSNRIRDHSADNILSTTSLTPNYLSSIQRSISCKRPQDINQTTYFNRTTFTIQKHDQQDVDEEEEYKDESILKDINVNNSISTGLNTSSSSQEHIYDNSTIFTHHKANIAPDLIFNEEHSSTNNIIKTKEQAKPTTNRLRPISMHIPTNNDKQINEFENVFNQIKNHGLLRKAQRKEQSEISTVPEELVPPRPSSVFIREPTKLIPNDKSLMTPLNVSIDKTVETYDSSQLLSRRKAGGGVHISPNNKYHADDRPPAPSWVGIARQKQNKFQAECTEKSHQEELDYQSISTMMSKKPVNVSSNVSEIVKESSYNDIQSHQKTVSNPVVLRRPSPKLASPTAYTIERESIRAFRSNNPNRINNLIQFFDK